MKKTLSIFFVMFIVLLLFGCGKKQDTLLAYRDEGEGCVVFTTRHKQMTTVEIPKKANGKKVIGIADHAFDSCGLLHSVKLPDTIKTIGAGAFCDCYNLGVINIPSSVTSIGSGAFDGCAFLHKIVIPDGIDTINSSTFRDCDVLNTITIPKSVTSIEDYAFHGCRCLDTIYYDGTEKEWYSITIGNYNDVLKNVTPKFKDGESEEYEVKFVTQGKGNAKIVSSEKLHYNSIVQIEATPGEGYYFSRWIDSSNHTISNSSTYEFALKEQTITFIAEFLPRTYSISVSNEEISTYQTIFDQMKNDIYDCVIPGVNIVEITNYKSDNKLDLKLEFDRTIDSQVDYRFRAKLLDLDWIPKNGIKYEDLNLNTTWEIYYEKYEDETYYRDVVYGSRYELPIPTKLGYKFDGWLHNGQKIANYDGNSISSYNYTNSIVVSASWTPLKYEVAIENDIDGLVVTGEGKYDCDGNVVLNASNIPDNYSICWKRSDGVTTYGNSCTFTMPYYNLSITLELALKYIREDNCIYFGYYPQTLEDDDSIIAELNDYAGIPVETNEKWISYDYYIKNVVSEYMYYVDVDLDGNGSFEYRGVYFEKYRPRENNLDSTSDNSWQDENGFERNKAYWFRYELIKWIIIEEKNGYAKIVSSVCLDSQCYNNKNSSKEIEHNGGIGYPYNYELSDIRVWLNNTFYNTAFSDYGKTLIKKEIVDNSASSTMDSTNPYYCNDTNDFVYLLSYQEIITSFPTAAERKASSTKYALIQGSYGGTWFTRSPHTYGESYISVIYSTGAVNMRDAVDVVDKIRPAICIKL